MARKSKKLEMREQFAKERGPVKKIRKKRKPMSEEQKAAAVERLAKARAVRLEKQGGPKNVHPDVLALDDDETLSLKNVRSWIKTQKDMLAAAKQEVRANAKGAVAKVARIEGYVRNLERYIKHGVYLDMFYGEHQQSRIKTFCVAMAYHPDGTPKRSYGVYYSDLGGVYISDNKIEVDGKIIEYDQ
jgi:hypothetical protein